MDKKNTKMAAAEEGAHLQLSPEESTPPNIPTKRALESSKTSAQSSEVEEQENLDQQPESSAAGKATRSLEADEGDSEGSAERDASTDSSTEGDNEDQESKSSAKRRASTTLERSPTKAVKSSDGSGPSRQGSVVAAGDGVTDKDAEIAEWKSKYEGLVHKANDKVRDLRAEIKALQEGNEEKTAFEDECHNLRGANAELEEELVNLRKKGTGGESSRNVSKRLEDDIKAKYEKMKSSLQRKHEQALATKVANKERTMQKKIDDLKEKKGDAEQQAKDAAKEEKELKRSLKAEQQEVIKNFKIECSKELKEKKDIVAKQEKRIEAMEKGIKKAGAEFGELQAERDHYRRAARNERVKVQQLEADLKAKDDFTLQIGQSYAAKSAQLKAELEAEGKKWARQKQCCDELTVKLVMQQRANFVLRNGNESAVAKVLGLQAELKGLRERRMVRGAGQVEGSKGWEGIGEAVEKGTEGVDGAQETGAAVNSPKGLSEEAGAAGHEDALAGGADTSTPDQQMAVDAAAPTTVLQESAAGEETSDEAPKPAEKADTRVAQPPMPEQTQDKASAGSTSRAEAMDVEQVGSPLAQPGGPKEDRAQVPAEAETSAEAMHVDGGVGEGPEVGKEGLSLTTHTLFPASKEGDAAPSEGEGAKAESAEA